MLGNIQEMMKKKGKKGNISDEEMRAKMSVLEDLKSTASSAMGDKLSKIKFGGEADSPEALAEAGEEIQEKAGEMMADEYEEDMEGEEYSDEEMEEEDEDFYEKHMKDAMGEDNAEEYEAGSMADEMEGEVKDYSALNPEELDDEIDRLLQIKEKMKSSNQY